MRSLLLALLAACVACSSEKPQGDVPDAIVAADAATDSSPPAENCMEVHKALWTRISAITGQYRSGCVTHTDCVLESRDIPCNQSCPIAIRADAGVAMRAELDAYGASVCPGTGCNSAGTCPAFETAVCADGVCRNGFHDGGVAFLE